MICHPQHPHMQYSLLAGTLYLFLQTRCNDTKTKRVILVYPTETYQYHSNYKSTEVNKLVWKPMDSKGNIIREYKFLFFPGRIL